MYIIEPFTNQIIEIAFSRFFNYISDDLKDFFKSEIVFNPPNENFQFIPISNCIKYTTIIDKCIDDYTAEDQELQDSYLKENNRLPPATYIYSVRYLIDTIKTQIKVYVDSSIHAGEKKINEIALELISKYLKFLLDFTPDRIKRELCRTLIGFINSMPGIEDIYIIHPITEVRRTWASLIPVNVINTLVEVINQEYNPE